MTVQTSSITTRHSAVQAILRPSSVAIVGAREASGGWADRIRHNILRFGFQGPVYAINPKHASLWGEPCYPDVFSTPSPPDHLVVLVPEGPAVASLAKAAEAGVRSATVFSGGSEGGTFGADLAVIARDTGLAISGPNCLGNVSVPGSLVTTTIAQIEELLDGPVAVVGQSGGIIHTLSRVLTGRGIGVRYTVSSGDETCLRTADYLDYFAQDETVKVVAAFVESVRDWPAFVASCQAMRAAGKHVVAIKVGQSAASREAAASHTGALAGAYDAFEAAAAGLGVVTVPSMDVAVEVCEYLTRLSPPKGPRLGMVTLSGGVRELLLDAAVRLDAQIPALGPATEEALGALIGTDVHVGNPQDSGYAGITSADTLAACAKVMAADESIDAVLVQEELPTRHLPAKERALAVFDDTFMEAEAPVALFSMCTPTAVTPFGREVRDRFDGLAFLQSVDKAVEAVTAIGRTERAARWRGEALAERPDTAAVARAARALLDEGHATEIVAKQMLAGYGFATPREAIAPTADAARSAAARLEAPYVVKVVASGLHHKSDAGGVALGLATPEAVAEACAEMQRRLPGVEGFLVSEQVTDKVEFVVGFVRDPEVGPVVMFGSGGTGVEVYEDVAFVPVPCSRAEARDAVRRTKGARLLGEWRGRPAGDEEALVSAVCAMSWFAEDLCDVVASAEVNPVVALPGRAGVLALDALVLHA